MELRLYYFDFTDWKKFQDVRLASCEILLIFLTEHRLLFGRGPNRVMETACFDANVQ